MGKNSVISHTDDVNHPVTSKISFLNRPPKLNPIIVCLLSIECAGVELYERLTVSPSAPPANLSVRKRNLSGGC